jgi:YfiH family protein
VELHGFSHPAFSDERLLACWTDRRGGASEGRYATLNVAFHVDDDPGAVLENRKRLAAELGVPLDSFVVADQVHGDWVHVVTEQDRGRGATSHETALPGTDAMVTREPGVVLAVMLADCVPVVVFDPVTPAVGLAHAGWAGTVRHVTRRTVETMQRELGTDPATAVAGIGPSIGPESYEVGPDVAGAASEAFPHASVLRPNSRGRLCFDLWRSNVTDLLDAGIPRDRIEISGVDTFLDAARYFSHRRDGGPDGHTGRFMTLAGLRPSVVTDPRSARWR